MTPKELFGLELTVVDKIRSVFSKYQMVEKAILYGSRAKGTQKNGSDIDIVLIGTKLTTTDLLRIENELDDLMLPYEIDVSMKHAIENQDLLEHIDRVGQVFYP